MFAEIMCFALSLVVSILPSEKLHDKMLEVAEKTFIISETCDDDMSNSAVRVFSDSKTLKKIITDKN